MNIFVRDVHNGMIKPPENAELTSLVDYVAHKALISDIALRSFILPQVCKTTPNLRHICGCELCIIPKDVTIDLNVFIKRLVKDLQKKYVVYLVLQILHITEIKGLQMVNVYMILSKNLLSSSHVFQLNKIT